MPTSTLRLRSGPTGSTDARGAAADASSNACSEFCCWNTDGALMPPPAFSDSFVSPRAPEARVAQVARDRESRHDGRAEHRVAFVAEPRRDMPSGPRRCRGPRGTRRRSCASCSRRRPDRRSPARARNGRRPRPAGCRAPGSWPDPPASGASCANPTPRDTHRRSRGSRGRSPSSHWRREWSPCRPGSWARSRTGRRRNPWAAGSGTRSSGRPCRRGWWTAAGSSTATARSGL